MKIDFNDYYGIGTVVSLKSCKKNMMIIGIAQIKIDEEKMYDYMGVIYPEGYVGPASCILFNKADIDEVIIEAKKSEETNFYINAMNNLIKSLNETVEEISSESEGVDFADRNL